MADVTIVNSGLLLHRTDIPTGPLIVVSVLEKAGFVVEFRDYQGVAIPKRPSPRTFKAFLDDCADLLGISVMSNSLPTVLGAVRLLKEEKPWIKVFLGGPGCRELAFDILQKFPVDAIVLGEGEITAPELVMALKNDSDLRRVAGIAYKEEDQVIFTKERPLIDDLDSIPFPAYHHIKLESYNNVATVMTARGCPFRCKFCSAHSVPQRKMRYRSIPSIMEELSLLAPQARYVAFLDDTFILSKARALEIARNVQNRFSLRYTCNAKISLMDDDWLKALADTGNFLVFYGVESGSNRVLERIGKGHTLEEARKVIRKTADSIEKVRTSYIWGYPFETLEDFFDTAMSLRQDMQQPNVLSQMSLLSPLPGTELTEEFKDIMSFSPAIQSRAGGLPVNENISDYPELIELITGNPGLFSSFYYFAHEGFESKFNAIKRIDWIYDDQKKRAYGY